MKKNNVNDIATLGITLALITLLTFVMPKITVVDLAYPLIPIFIVAQIKGWKMGVISSTFYGIMSLVNAFTVSTSVLRFAFYNPMVSVFPRVIVGIVVSLFFKFLYDKTKNLKNRNGLKLTSYFSALLGVLTNSILVLSMLYLFNNNKVYGDYTISLKFIFAIIVSTNTLIELIVFPLITAPIVYAVKKNQSIIIP
jgi:uncharacterized membrane protein